MGVAEYLLAALLAVLLGLDRVALLQSMACRPLVAAPLTGAVLGDAALGLEIGIILELLWLGRLPVGAAIPPDDTQVAVGATVLALTGRQLFGLQGLSGVMLPVMAAIPLGMVGQYLECRVRQANGRLESLAFAAASVGAVRRIEHLHLAGLLHFAAASVATCTCIVVGGAALLWLLAAPLNAAVRAAGPSWPYSFPLIGAAVLIGTLHVRRGPFLFGLAFGGTLLGLWLW